MIEIRSTAYLDKIVRMTDRYLDAGTEESVLHELLTSHPWLLGMLKDQFEIAKSVTFSGKRREFTLTEKQMGAHLKLRVVDSGEVKVTESYALRHFEELKKCLVSKVLCGFLNLFDTHYPSDAEGRQLMQRATFEKRWGNNHPVSGELVLPLTPNHSVILSL